MILVENFRSGLYIQPLLRLFVPRQVEDRVEIIAQDGGLGGAGLLAREARNFTQQLFLRLLRKLQRLNFGAVAVRVAVVVLAEFFADDVQLLAQIIIALVLVDILLHLIVDLAFQPQNVKLLRHHADAQLQPVNGRQRFEHALLVLVAERRVLGDEIGQLARVVGRRALQQVFLPGFDGQIDKLLKQLVRLPHERLRARHGGVIARLVQLHRAGEEIRLGVDHVGQLRAVFALDENAHIIARQAQDLPHIGHGADGIQVGLLRLVALHVALGDKEDHLIGPHGLLNGAGRPAPSDVEMRHAAGEHHDPAQRQDRQAGKGFIVAHKSCLLSRRIKIRRKGAHAPFLFVVLQRYACVLDGSAGF